MRSLAIGFCILLFSACNQEEKASKKASNLPKTVSIQSLKQTDFSITLESPVQPAKNFIYAPTLLYAWDVIRQGVGPLQMHDSSSEDLKYLNSSTSFFKSLEPGEYEVEVHDENGAYHVRTFFSKALPFATKMRRMDKGLVFDSTKVDYFGMDSYDGDIASQAEILYYKDDEHFVLRLMPRDSLHEIILAKGIKSPSTLARALKETYEMIGTGKKKRSNPGQQWKYSISEEDVFQVPVIEFNLEKEFPTLMGQTFQGKIRSHRIEYAYQRNALVLNENGAIVESEAEMAVDSVAVSTEIPKPKKMILDKPFLLVIKKKRSPNPYFVMWVANAELMKR